MRLAGVARPRDPDLLESVPRPMAALADEYSAGHLSPPHSHKRAQLLYASAGVMSLLTREGSFVVPPQRAVWIPQGTVHEVYYRSHVSIRTLYVDPQAHPGLPRDLRVIEVSNLLSALILEAVQFPLGYDLEGRQGRIVSLLLDEICSLPATSAGAPVPADPRLARVCRLILQDPSRDESMSYWAKAAGMSRRTLVRLFQQEMGMSFAAWRRHVRLLEVLPRLATGESVARVAFDVGYRSHSAFTAMFRRTFGISPSRYSAPRHSDPAPER